MSQKTNFKSPIRAALLLAGAMLAVSPAVQADKGMRGHGDGPMMMGQSHGKMHKGDLYPHNAAAHFLKMADMLKLSPEQIGQLRRLRDDYIAKHAVHEDQLKAARSDLMRELYADDIDMARVNALFEQIGKLEGELWRAFAEQLKSVKGVLNATQKQMLRDLHSGMDMDHGKGMGRGAGGGHGGMMMQ